MKSLRIYLSHDRSLKATSEVLHVHKQTVVYRMRRVEELTGGRMGRMQDIANLWLAMKALDLIGQNGEDIDQVESGNSAASPGAPGSVAASDSESVA